MWPSLARSWAPARAVRPDQPLLVLDRPAAVPGDESVQRARPAEIERYLPAAAAMFAEELGVSPHVAPGTGAFRSRVADLLSSGRAFASYDFRGQVTFKAEISAGLAAVIEFALELAPTVSLYVNDYNTAARRTYARLGMRQVATLSTVLL
jgi:uncharacterized protein